MLGHEKTDAAMYASWGIDFIKLDMGCRSDTSIHDGTSIACLERVRDGLNATGRPIVFYIDAGNPTSGPRVFNPMHRGMPDDLFTRTHVANAFSEVSKRGLRTDEARKSALLRCLRAACQLALQQMRLFQLT